MIEAQISLKVAKLAKEKGFNIGCKYLYGEYDGYNGLHRVDNYNQMNNDNQFSAPTHTLLKMWLAKNYKIMLTIHYQWEYNTSKEVDYIYHLNDLRIQNASANVLPYIEPMNFERIDDNNKNWKFDEAFDAGLLEALKLIKI